MLTPDAKKHFGVEDTLSMTDAQREELKPEHFTSHGQPPPEPHKSSTWEIPKSKGDPIPNADDC